MQVWQRIRKTDTYNTLLSKIRISGWTGDAMRLVLEDFMAQMKELKGQMSSMQSKHVDLENRLSEEHKLRKSAERKIKSLQEKLDYANQERFGDRRQKIKSKS